MMETRILIVDDDPFICRQLEELYTSQRYAVSCAPNSTEALRLLGEQEFALAVVDLKIPGTDGIGLTREIRDRWPDLDVIMITGYASIKGAVEAIKQGASDYITKPFQKEEILLATEKILEKRRLLDEINYLRSQLSDRYSFANMVSRNRVMHEIFETISVLAQNDATVLIYGESGTGKELAARAIHFQGKRKSGRFVAINCAAFPDTLLESELFGYERGAFTGAIHDRVGKIELSSGGTLFLDEIESISLNMQLKLLRVLEEREVEKLGSNRRIKVNMRIICATNMELAAAVAEGRMREDFYYRINVVPLRIPPLRERIEDIPLLVGEFLRNSEMAREKGINRLSNKALSQLMSYAWPGNVRELGNVIERAILRTSGSVIREVDLPGHSSVGREISNGNGRQAGYDYEVPLKEYLRRAEKDYLTRVLRKYRGGINLSAKHALVDAATLHRKMKLHGLRREEYRFRGKLDGTEAVGSS
jgi:DNA-binding NtrC family response regulator